MRTQVPLCFFTRLARVICVLQSGKIKPSFGPDSHCITFTVLFAMFVADVTDESEPVQSPVLGSAGLGMICDDV